MRTLIITPELASSDRISPSGIWNRFTSLTTCLPEPLRRLQTLRIALY
jgi:hypothetical protein